VLDVFRRRLPLLRRALPGDVHLRVGGEAGDQVVHHGPEGRLPAEPVVQGLSPGARPGRPHVHDPVIDRVVRRHVVGEIGAKPAVVGFVFGFVASIGIGRAMSSVVYGVRTFDVGVSVVVIALTTLVVLAATYLAARRALAVEPIEALKQE